MVPYIDIHTHKCTIGSNIVLYNLKNNETPYSKMVSFGIHPWDLDGKTLDHIFDKLRNFCQQNLIISIGEIGIDRSIKFPVNEQIKVFEQQHILAEEYNLPIIIHCVKAWSDFLAIRNRIKPKIPWIFHGYSGNLNIAHQLIERGCYLSFGQHLLNSAKLQEVFKVLPIEGLFLETDNSEVSIEEIYQIAANLRNIDLIDLKFVLNKNFCTVFNVTN